MTKKQKKFYAVKLGFCKETNQVIENRIYSSWEKVKPLVIGINKKEQGITPIFKSFKTKEEANAFFQDTEKETNTFFQDTKEVNAFFQDTEKVNAFFQDTEEQENNKKAVETYEDCIHAYVDGSCLGNKAYSYGLVLVKNNKLIHLDYGVGKGDKSILKSHQIGGEFLGAMKAMLKAKDLNAKKLIIYYDYEGIRSIANGNHKAKTPVSKGYFDFLQKFKENHPTIEIEYIKVKAHSGNDFNEIVDGLAKLALDIKPNSIFYKTCEKFKDELFAGYTVLTNKGTCTEFPIANKHQIQQIAMLLDSYESFK